MTRAEAWERFEAEGNMVIWRHCGHYFAGWSVAGVWNGAQSGPTPEAAIAAAFGETLEDDAR
jgi:hypothetical protein